MKRFLVHTFCFASSLMGFSQLSFTVDEEYCREESVTALNTSTGFSNYEWDFCLNDIELGTVSSTTAINIPALSNPIGFWIGRDNGNWYAFIVNNTQNELYRLDFGSDLFSTPTSTNLGNPGDLFNGPGRIDIIQIDGNWYGVVAYFSFGSEITLLDFGSSLSNIPTASSLGNFGLSRTLTPRVIMQGTDILLVLGYYDGNSIFIANYGNSFGNIPTTTTHAVSMLTKPRGIDIVKDSDGNWIIFATTENTQTIHEISFGTDITSAPVSEEIHTIGLFNNPTTIDLIQEGSQFYAFVSNFSFDGTLVDFNNLTSSPTSSSQTHISRTSSTSFIRQNGQSTIIGVTTSDNLNLSNYSYDCIALPYSNLENPSSISYSTENEYRIELRSEENNEVITIEDTITILGMTAPSISFTSDNVCINSLVNFSPSNTGLTLYEWDFNGDDIVDVTDMTGAAQSFDYSGLGTGTYTARLDVSDGTCNNFFEQEITIYDPPPAPSYTYSSVRTCINADFTFTNITADGAYAGPLQYLWEFIDEPSGTIVATATTKDAVYAFETAGEKTVRLTSSIPGCTEVTEQTLMITPGPTADFFAASVCQNEAMDFTNTSTDATAYSWNFGDGFMSTATNPSHVFTGAGNFFVTLTAFDAEGCEDTEVIEVAISDSPQISFNFDIPCTSSDGIQFFDLTTVDNADLVTWTWFVDDVEVSNQQSPQITFSSTGVKNIRLDVQSSNGCESSYNEDIEVLASPAPDFTIDLGCQGETSSFTDNTSATGNPIVSWLWTVDGTNYGTQDISHLFTDAGTYDVTLEVTGQNFCSEAITKSVEIVELPTVSFAIQGECDNQLIRASDQSTVSADPVISRRWMLDGENVGNGTELILSELADDTYVLSLELETQEGCIISASQALIINEAPQSSFTSSRTYGVPNDQLTFTNTSIGGVSYQWLLDGLPRSTNPQSEPITFTESGTYNVSLVTQNSLGCNDTTHQEILIAIPEVDLAIGSFELVSENNVGRIFLEVQNFSNLPVEIIDAQIVLENTFTISEQIISFIDIGESRLVNLNVGIPLNISEPSYFCVKLSSQYSEYQDLDPVNNEKCITIEPVIKVEDPFPNPVRDQFRLKLIVNESGAANISLINSAGKIQINNVEPVSKGLNNFFIDMSLLDPGIYYVTVDVLGTTHKRKVIKL
ncbi:PKD domain-containing protein [Ekhidna sp.]|uniref:PKD domain-containing protein n=1 Tax=Ekhidna sp. TaxID=2608089 RepID=UPI00329A1370